MNSVTISALENIARAIRRSTVEAIGHVGVGHIGGSLSIADVLTVLYFREMRIDSTNSKMEGRDRFILSKGHAGPALYATLAEKGYFSKDMLGTMNTLNTKLPSHCDMNRTPGIDMTTGSLGQGFSCAVGVAVGSKIKGDGALIYTLIGDGESQEGQIWEAAMFAAQMKLDNLIAFTDYNRKQIDGTTDEINSLEDIAGKWHSFGWHTKKVDGHDMKAIIQAIQRAKDRKGKPSMIILETTKGKGVSFVEKAGVANHNMTLTREQVETALEELNE